MPNRTCWYRELTKEKDTQQEGDCDTGSRETDDTYKRESEKKHLGNTVEHDQIDETGSNVNTKHTGQESARDRGMNRDADWQINMETRLT